jgi:ABC-type polysaccharide/polyol phosphate transport system ATPase subunit
MNKDWRRHDYGAASLIKNGRMMNTPFFELRNITKYFSQVIANKDVSFPIFRGEVLALLGENGAGKSTAMKILYGLYKADSGDILMNGEKKTDSFTKRCDGFGNFYDPATFFFSTGAYSVEKYHPRKCSWPN